jgi:hypothetical protein
MASLQQAQPSAIHGARQDIATSTSAGSKANYCDFAQWGVVPDVVKSNPAHWCEVRYGNKAVTCGNVLTPEETSHAPTVVNWPVAHNAIQGSPQLYTLIMLDPDAPSREQPKFRNWLHWMLVNVPGPDQLNGGFEVASYNGPTPPPNTGLHRYCFLVYPQHNVIKTGELPHFDSKNRGGWSLDKWTNIIHAGIIDPQPVWAGNMFQCGNKQQAGGLHERKEQGPEQKEVHHK